MRVTTHAFGHVDHIQAALEVQVRGGVGADERDCAHAMVSAVLAHHRQSVSHARLRLTGSAGAGTGVAQVNLLVHSAPARIQVAGQTMAATISAAAARLNRQIRRLTTAWEPWPWPGSRTSPPWPAGTRINCPP